MPKLQLFIPEPCHENWGDMTPNEQGRFCNSCAKTVVDFSAMTDSQMIDYFTKLKNENVCGRVNTDQLQRPMQKDLSVHSKISFYWKYALAFFLFTGKGQQTKAQGLMLPVSTEKLVEKRSVVFQIVDDQQNPIPNASIKFSSGKLMVADSLGKITIGKELRYDVLTISAIGFEERVIAVKDIVRTMIPLKPIVKELEAVVVSTGLDEIRCSKNLTYGGLGYMVVEQKSFVRDTFFSIADFIKPVANVYPNPVAKGNIVNIDLKLSQPGMHKFTIIDAMGRLVFAQNYQLAAKKATQQITVPSSWTGGTYFLVIYDEKGKKIGKEKIVVQ